LCSYNLQKCDATPLYPLGELTALPRHPGWILGEERKEKSEKKGEKKRRMGKRERKMK